MSEKNPRSTATKRKEPAGSRALSSMARSEGLEPPTYKFVACCSIQLSYDRTAATVTSRFFFSLRKRDGGEGGIRTLGRFLTVGHLANDWFQPLTHLSVGPDHYTTRAQWEPAHGRVSP